MPCAVRAHTGHRPPHATPRGAAAHGNYAPSGFSLSTVVSRLHELVSLTSVPCANCGVDNEDVLHIFTIRIIRPLFVDLVRSPSRSLAPALELVKDEDGGVKPLMFIIVTHRPTAQPQVRMWCTQHRCGRCVIHIIITLLRQPRGRRPRGRRSRPGRRRGVC